MNELIIKFEALFKGHGPIAHVGATSADGSGEANAISSNNAYNTLLAVPVRAGNFLVNPKIRRPQFWVCYI